MATVYELVKKHDEGHETSYGMYSYEHRAIQKCKRFNDDIIMKLTREIATLNGAVRGQGAERMSQIRTILTNLPYSVKKIEVDDRY